MMPVPKRNARVGFKQVAFLFIRNDHDHNIIIYRLKTCSLKYLTLITFDLTWDNNYLCIGGCLRHEPIEIIKQLPWQDYI